MRRSAISLVLSLGDMPMGVGKAVMVLMAMARAKAWGVGMCIVVFDKMGRQSICVMGDVMIEAGCWISFEQDYRCRLYTIFYSFTDDLEWYNRLAMIPCARLTRRYYASSEAEDLPVYHDGLDEVRVLTNQDLAILVGNMFSRNLS